MEAKISEIFYSVQGEGIYQFVPQVFVRFFGCNLNCDFCDTKNLPYKKTSLEDAIEKIYSFKNFRHSISLTGGEPLLQIGFLKKLCTLLKEKGETLYLETNGVLPENLREVIDFIDIVSMDFKLPSSTKLGSFWPQHYKFLKEACKKKVFVKAVVTFSTEKSDLFKALEIIKEMDSNIFFVLQPVFSFEAILFSKLEEFRRIALKFIPNVRIIPQIHKYIGVK